MLKSLYDLHIAGFLHRDVKPSNFAIEHQMNGSLNRGLVYVFDFGLCRQYINPVTGQMRDARANVPFRGTVRYASVDVLSVSFSLLIINSVLPLNHENETVRVKIWVVTMICGRSFSFCPK